jgi:hypothetical protein
MREIKNHYFKHKVDSNGKPITFMSGLPLPISEDGKVHNVKFVNCDFHPYCDPETYPELFVDCEFKEQSYGDCDYEEIEGIREVQALADSEEEEEEDEEED